MLYWQKKQSCLHSCKRQDHWNALQQLCECKKSHRLHSLAETAKLAFTLRMFTFITVIYTSLIEQAIPMSQTRSLSKGSFHPLLRDLVNDSLPHSSAPSHGPDAPIPTPWHTHLQLRAPAVVSKWHGKKPFSSPFLLHYPKLIDVFQRWAEMAYT